MELDRRTALSFMKHPTIKSTKGANMTWEEFEGSMMQLKGKIKEKWGQFTDDEWTEIEGEFEQFCGLLKKKYSADKELRDHTVGK